MVGNLRPVGVVAAGWGWRHARRLAWAVRGVDLVIDPGERVLLLGASGAGKSTLVHAMAGVLGDGEQEGSLLVDGSTPRPGHAGLVLQDPDSQVIMAQVGDDVAFGCENLGVASSEIWMRVREALADIGLDVPLNHRTEQLSGGQKQRLVIAGAIAMRPGLLLLDEPTANLDPAGVIEVRDATSAVIAKTGATLVVIEHRVEAWQDHVDRIVVLSPGGGVLADGTPRRMLADRGEQLAAMGIWVPERPPRVPVRRVRPAPEPLLRVSGLVATGFEVSSASVLAITGANGSGKTTLGLALAGLTAPVGGSVVATPALADGLSPHPSAWKSRQLLGRIGFVFQNPEHQFVARTVRAELEAGPRALALPAREIERRMGRLFDRLRLAPLAEANPFTLSGGEKRRLSVATALASEPRVLVLDEPTFGQDSRTWSELVAFLTDLVDDGSSLVMMTHDALLVDAIADTSVALQ